MPPLIPKRTISLQPHPSTPTPPPLPPPPPPGEKSQDELSLNSWGSTWSIQDNNFFIDDSYYDKSYRLTYLVSLQIIRLTLCPC